MRPPDTLTTCRLPHATPRRLILRDPQGCVRPLRPGAVSTARRPLTYNCSMRILLLVSPNSYRAAAFLDAARRLGLEVTRGIDVPPGLASFASAGLALDYRDPAGAARAIVAYAAGQPLAAVVPIDDEGTAIA